MEVRRTYWFIKLVFPTPLSPKMMTCQRVSATIPHSIIDLSGGPERHTLSKTFFLDAMLMRCSGEEPCDNNLPQALTNNVTALFFSERIELRDVIYCLLSRGRLSNDEGELESSRANELRPIGDKGTTTSLIHSLEQ